MPRSRAVLVFLPMAKYVKSSVDKSLNDVRDKRLLTTDADKISHIELIRKNQECRIQPQLWPILRRVADREAQNRCGLTVFRWANWPANWPTPEWIWTLPAAKMLFSSLPGQRPSPPRKLLMPSGTQELQVRKSASRQGQEQAAPIMRSRAWSVALTRSTRTSGSRWTRIPTTFAIRSSFDFGYADPGKIEFHDGSKSYFLVRSGEDWWWNGKKMEAGNVQSLVSDLRDLTADKFLDSGFANPTIEAVVTSEDGKRVEKVQIAKSTNGYVAKRENEPALYQLTFSSVDDLQKAASAIKPAAAPAK